MADEPIADVVARVRGYANERPMGSYERTRLHEAADALEAATAEVARLTLMVPGEWAKTYERLREDVAEIAAHHLEAVARADRAESRATTAEQERNMLVDLHGDAETQLIAAEAELDETLVALQAAEAALAAERALGDRLARALENAILRDAPASYVHPLVATHRAARAALATEATEAAPDVRHWGELPLRPSVECRIGGPGCPQRESNHATFLADEARAALATGRETACRKCGQPIDGADYRFGSPETGWEHMAGECALATNEGAAQVYPDGSPLPAGVDRDSMTAPWDD